jgi:predicted amidohydrolase
MRIALGQVDCRLGNIPANLATHADVLTAVQQQGGADLVLFPELSLTGYRLRSNIQRAMLDDAQLARAWGQLREQSAVPPETCCVLGYVELSARSALHNSTVIACGEQARRFRHRKVYLPTYGMFEEERYMRPGDRFRTIDLTWGGQPWRVGILCCEDAWHSSAWTIMQARGVDLVLVNSASPGRGVEAERLGSQQSWYGILSTFAELSGCWVAYCNRVGFEDDIHFWGGSAVFAPTGEMMAQGAMLDPDIVHFELEKQAITRARLMVPLAADEDWALTQRELGDAQQEILKDGQS